MNACDFCGEDRFVEELGFDHRGWQTPEDFWRVARVCEECREEKVMPALRQLAGDGGLNLEPADGDGWEPVVADGDVKFHAFTTGRGTTHVARVVFRAVAMPDEYRCVGHCGIEARVEPEPRRARLSARLEGITVCGRCAKSAPYRVGAKA